MTPFPDWHPQQRRLLALYATRGPGRGGRYNGLVAGLVAFASRSYNAGWCNGSTGAFGASCLGSNPSPAAT